MLKVHQKRKATHLSLACVRFFGYLSVINPDALTRFNLFTQEIFDQVNHFDQLDPVRRQLAFDTLALITTSSNAKQLLTQRQCKIVYCGLILKNLNTLVFTHTLQLQFLNLLTSNFYETNINVHNFPNRPRFFCF